MYGNFHAEFGLWGEHYSTPAAGGAVAKTGC